MNRNHRFANKLTPPKNNRFTEYSPKISQPYLEVLEDELPVGGALPEQVLGALPPAVLQQEPLHEGLVRGAGEEGLLVQEEEEPAAVGGGEVGLGGARPRLLVDQGHHRGRRGELLDLAQVAAVDLKKNVTF